MKRKISVLMLVMAMLFLVSCGSGKSFNNVSAYSDKWGNLGWEYYYGELSWNPSRMAYIDYYGCYRSTRVTVTKEEWQPHQEHDIIMGFKSPLSGKAKINITLEIINIQRPEDDGVLFTVCDNSKEELYSIQLEGTGENSSDTLIFNIKLDKGDYVWFVLAANAAHENDLTRVCIDVGF